VTLADLASLLQALAEDRPAAPADPGRVRAHGLAPLAFTHGRSEFRADYALSSIRAEQQREIAREAVDALQNLDVPVILMKGISYAGWLYPDPAERPMSDVDLLVPGELHERAVAQLGKLGYRHEGPAIQRSPRHHAMSMKRPNAAVDLHRGPAQEGRIRIPMAEVRERATLAPWIPGAFRLAELDELLFHVANLARHDLIVPLISFVDAGRMLRRLDGGARAELRRTATHWRFGRVLDACLDEIEHVCGWRAERSHWWLPRRDEVLSGQRPRRTIQIGRKLFLVEGPRELSAYGRSVVDGWITALRRS
jgi:hypothetical protein